MFNAVLFDDINKSAFDVMKDGYSFDQKVTMKTAYKRMNFSFEAKDFSSAISGKCTFDSKVCDYVNLKKMSVDNNGNGVCDMDITELLKGTTLMVRSMGNVKTNNLTKMTCGMKIMLNSMATDFNFDAITKKYSTSLVYARNQLMAGVKLQGSQKELMESVDAGVAYCYKDMVASISSCGNHSAINAALYAKPYKNVRFGASCKLALTETENPVIAFGVCMNPGSVSEMRVKLSSDGQIGCFYKYAVNKVLTIATTSSMEFNNIMNGSHKIGFAVDIRL